MIRKWLKLFSLLALLAGIFWLASQANLDEVPVLRETKQQEIDASALFYTDSPIARKNYFRQNQ